MLGFLGEIFEALALAGHPWEAAGSCCIPWSLTPRLYDCSLVWATFSLFAAYLGSLTCILAPSSILYLLDLCCN